MVELLAKHSQLLVKEAENGMAVNANKVYFIPNDKFVAIRDGKLYLSPKDKIQGPHLTINAFFNPLAADSGKNAIAVILSGLGSDGSEGIKAIKRKGGMVIVRNPETSEFSSIPSNAIATGAVDRLIPYQEDHQCRRCKDSCKKRAGKRKHFYRLFCGRTEKLLPAD